MLSEYHGMNTYTYSNGKFVSEIWNKGELVEGEIKFANGDIYKGKISNGEMNGRGKYIWKENDEQYDGEWKNGVREGKGISTYKIKRKSIETIQVGKDHRIKIKPCLDQESSIPNYKYAHYIGQWRDDKYHGKGIYKKENGVSYDGIWENGELNSGTIKRVNGNIYRGEIRNYIPHGKGSLTTEKCIFDGIWEKGKFRKGTVISADGTYKGEIHNYLPHGKGTMEIGESKYIGDFKKGVREGKGEIKYFNGDYYKGDFKEDEKDGLGIEIIKDHFIYIGEFKEGKYCGKGTMIFTCGRCLGGIWEDGYLKIKEKMNCTKYNYLVFGIE